MPGTVGESTDSTVLPRSGRELRGLRQPRPVPDVLSGTTYHRPTAQLVAAVAVLCVLLLAGGVLVALRHDRPAEVEGVARPTVAAGPPCWDGGERTDGACRPLEGEEALRWIMGPGLDLTTCTSDVSGKELETFTCAAAGSAVNIVLSRWANPRDAREYLDRNLGAGQDNVEAATTTWRLDAFPEEPTMAGYAYAYQNYPFSIAVTGTVAERDAVVRQLRPRTAAALEVSQ